MTITFDGRAARRHFARGVLGLLVLAAGCRERPPATAEGADERGHTAPTRFTREANRAVLDALPFADRRDLEDAARGLIASDPDLVIRGAGPEPVWNMPAWAAFMQDEAAPDSVNPSLWRHERMNNRHGLFRVTDGIYQLRGYDASNLSIIEGRTGWIIVDPLTTDATAKRAIAFARAHLGDRPIVAMIYTHSHVDHFGGSAALVAPEEVAARGLRIVAPAGFVHEASSENILLGPAMGRRSIFQFGGPLAPAPRGAVGSGIGKTVPYGAMVTLIPPTEFVDRTPQEMTIDGVRFVFQYTPHSEAPAELTFYLPERQAFCGAEIVTRTLHNVLTLRGAKVRDTLLWAGYIDEAVRLFADAEVVFNSHHWPVWGNERVIDYLKKQRDTYKFIHDQTVRLANKGYTPTEIADRIVLPSTLAESFGNRGYYGTVSHNARAVYQFYLGWYDGNPANLDPLPPADAAARYVALMGGADRVIEAAQQAFDAGEYRWAAQLLNHLVFAAPEHREARALLAGTYDQLAYRAESGIWRNVYLTGAHELRHGAPDHGIDRSFVLGMLRHAPLSSFFDAMAATLDPQQADGLELTVNVRFTDVGETYVLNVENAVLHHRKVDRPDPGASVTLSVTKDLYLRMAIGTAGLTDTVFSDDVSVEGSKLDLVRFLRLFDPPDATFNIVTP